MLSYFVENVLERNMDYILGFTRSQRFSAAASIRLISDEDATRLLIKGEDYYDLVKSVQRRLIARQAMEDNAGYR